MQVATQPGQAAYITGGGQTHKDVLLNSSQYLFSPLEELKPDPRTTGIKVLRRNKLELIETHHYPERSTDEAVMKGEEMAYTEPVANYAYGIANSLFNDYAEFGVIIVRSLTGVNPALAAWVEKVLLDDAPLNIVEMQVFINRESVSRLVQAEMPQELDREFNATKYNTPRELLQAVRSELAASCARGESYAREYRSRYIGEMKKAENPKEQGISYVHPKLRTYCAELGVSAPDDIAADVNRKRSEAMQQQIVISQPSDGLKREQCPHCGELVALINGKMPRKCKECGENPQLPPYESEVKGEELPIESPVILQKMETGEQIMVTTETKPAEVVESKTAATITEKSEAVFDKEDPFGTKAKEAKKKK